MRHADIWRALDRLAEANGLTPSGLAKAAELDATTFNRSKRQTRDGRQRWPSTQSVSRALDAVGATLDDLAALMDGRQGAAMPVLGFAKAGDDGYFDAHGLPTGTGWGEVRMPGLGDDPVYALQVSGDSMEPAYREGDTLVVSPTASCLPGDRVVARLSSGEVLAKVLGKESGGEVPLVSLNPHYPERRVASGDINWMARIVWASQ